MTTSTTRRALNCLQYESNGQNIVGNQKSLNQNITSNPKLSFLETNDRLTKLKKRHSHSLPDINLLLSSRSDMQLQSNSSSNTSTPNNKSAQNPKQQQKKMLSTSKSNISIVFEDEKENPSYITKAKLRNMENKISKKVLTVKGLEKQKAKTTHEMNIQCNKSEEDMVFNDCVNGTDYWRLIAHKRMDALDKTKIENMQLHKGIEALHDKNEELRGNIKELYELIENYKVLQKAALEEYEEGSEIDDSGFDVVQ